MLWSTVNHLNKESTMQGPVNQKLNWIAYNWLGAFPKQAKLNKIILLKNKQTPQKTKPQGSTVTQIRIFLLKRIQICPKDLSFKKNIDTSCDTCLLCRAINQSLDKEKKDLITLKKIQSSCLFISTYIGHMSRCHHKSLYSHRKWRRDMLPTKPC